MASSNPVYLAIVLALGVCVIGGAFYYAKQSGRAECRAEQAEKEKDDGRKAEKKTHEIRHVTDIDLDGRLDKWMRD